MTASQMVLTTAESSRGGLYVQVIRSQSVAEGAKIGIGGRRIAAASEGMKPLRLALSNAEVKTWTIGISLIRVVVGFAFIVVQWAIVKVVVAVGREDLLRECPDRVSR